MKDADHECFHELEGVSIWLESFLKELEQQAPPEGVF